MCQKAKRHFPLSLHCVWFQTIGQKSFFKVALSFPINKFPTKNVLRIQHTYIIINTSYEGICVKFEQNNKTTKQHWISYFQIAPRTFKQVHIL